MTATPYSFGFHDGSDEGSETLVGESPVPVDRLENRISTLAASAGVPIE